MKTLILVFSFLVANQAMAFEKESSFLDLKSAIEESNKESNESRKKLMNEENERIVDWGVRGVRHITIEADISVEKKEVNGNQVNVKPKVIHEISMNN